MASTLEEERATAGSCLWSHVTSAWGMSLLELATISALVGAAVVLMHVLAQARSERKRLPPGPWAWPVVGNLLVMASATPPRALEKLAAKYGSIMYLRFGSKPCVVISTAAAAKEVFRRSNEAIVSDRPKGLFAQVFSDNYRTVVHAPHGPYWRQLRRFCSSELLSPKTVASYRGVREDELRNMMAILEAEAAKGETINVKSWLFELTTNNMTKMLVNKRYFGNGDVASQEEKGEIFQLFSTLMRLMLAPVISDYIPSMSFLTKLRGQDRLLKERCDDAVRVVGKMTELEKHRERREKEQLGPGQYCRENNCTESKQYVPDFVDMITAEPLGDEKPLSDRTLTLLLIELLLGGTETAATTTEWAMAEVMAHPDILRRAREELDAVMGSRDGRLMQDSDVPNLPLLQAIVKETFRLHPPAPLAVPRASSQVVEAWGYRIPAGSQLMLNLRAIHRDPACYSDPDEFIPQRFLDRPEVNPLSGFDSHELMPFGVGRRMCPGAHLGNTMVLWMLGNLIRGFNWSFPKGQSVETCRRDNLDEIFGITACRKEPLCLVAKSIPR